MRRQLWLLGMLLASTAYSQDDFKTIFARDYARAEQFIARETWMQEAIRNAGLKPREVIALVFPEIIRFNSIQDKAEVFALQSLYVTAGQRYANFSIGPFQIKPSFAESIEHDAVREKISISSLSFTDVDTAASVENRARRVKRLQRLRDALNYVCLMVRWIDIHYPVFNSEEARIKFLSAAYNCGYRKPAEEIRGFITRKFFHTGLTSSASYAYADVAWYFYQHTSLRE